jgi:hypothetical protein
MSAIRTFTVTVSDPGSGNKYFIDGVQQDTVNLAEGYTYLFNYPSAHPFRFSTTSDGTHNSGSEYTTGVTVNSSTQVQITVAASAPTLYYYCSSHSGMGGQANTPESDSWNVLQWGQNSYGTQDTANVFPTSVSFTSDIGSVIASPDRGWGADTWSNGEWGELNDDTALLTGLSFSASLGTLVGSSLQGWGRAEWGNEPWGESNSPVVSISGLSFSTALGTLDYAQSISGWGRDEYGVGDWGENATTVVIEGLTMDTAMGPENWGVNSWGFGQWGGEFTFNVADVVGISGFNIPSSLGTLITNFDFKVTPTGVTTGAGLGTLSLNNGADHTQGLASFAVPASVGSVSADPQTVATPTGQTVGSSVGSMVTGTVEFVPITGISFGSTLGSLVSPVDQITVGLSSQTFSSAVGTISPTEMVMGLTGQEFTASLNTVGFGSIGYKDIDISGNPNYTDVTIAS